jgi:hypothetical protein
MVRFTEEEVKTFNLTKHELNSCNYYTYIFYPWNELEPLLIQVERKKNLGKIILF